MTRRGDPARACSSEPHKGETGIRRLLPLVITLCIISPAAALARHTDTKPAHRRGCNTARCDRHADRTWQRRHRPCPLVMAFLTKPRRFTPPQAAGLVGNFMQESGGDPYAAGGGLDQGQGSRDHTGPLIPQLRAIWDELRGPYRAALNAVRSASSPEAAARAFSDLFEEPSEPNMSAREAYAREALRLFPRWCWRPAR